MKCSVIESSHLIGKKWAIPLIEEIAAKKFRSFNGFLAKSDIAPTMLSAQLKDLEMSGLIRKHKNQNLNATKYVLTQKGSELHGLIGGIKEWNIKWNKVPEFCLHTTCTECPVQKSR